MKQITLCACTVVMLLSCSKKDSKNNPVHGNNSPNPTTVLNANEKLVVGTWILERIVDSNYSGTTLIDVKDGVPYPCGQDDRYVFSADKTYYKDEGSDTCSSATQYGILDWSISSETNRFDYKHGPGQLYADGTYRSIDNNHFAVYSQRFLHNNKSTVVTYYYSRK